MILLQQSAITNVFLSVTVLTLLLRCLTCAPVDNSIDTTLLDAAIRSAETTQGAVDNSESVLGEREVSRNNDSKMEHSRDLKTNKFDISANTQHILTNVLDLVQKAYNLFKSLNLTG